MEGKIPVQSGLKRMAGAAKQSRARGLGETLALQLSSLSDPDLQLYSLGERLRRMPAREGAMILAQICKGREEGNPLFEQAHLHLLAKETLLGVLGEAKVASLLDELRLLGCEDAQRYLMKDPPNLRFERDQEGERRPREALGTRISLARKTTPRIIEKLIYDPDERVIGTILENPRVTEGEVLKITSSPRTPPSILATIGQDQKWICCYKVKLSLVYNPNTPLRISLGLLPLLLRQDLLEIAQYEILSPLVRGKATRLAEMRSPEKILRSEEGERGDHFSRIYQLVSSIPWGEVATYGQIAGLLGDPRGARTVGWALHSNPYPGKVPCHRVVNKRGELSGGFAFGGPEVQRSLLEVEGVTFLPKGRVDLARHLWRPEGPPHPEEMGVAAEKDRVPGRHSNRSSPSPRR